MLAALLNIQDKIQYLLHYYILYQIYVGQYISSATSLIRTRLIWTHYIQFDPNLVRLLTTVKFIIKSRMLSTCLEIAPLQFKPLPPRPITDPLYTAKVGSIKWLKRNNAFFFLSLFSKKCYFQYSHVSKK